MRGKGKWTYVTGWLVLVSVSRGKGMMIKEREEGRADGNVGGKRSNGTKGTRGGGPAVCQEMRIFQFSRIQYREKSRFLGKLIGAGSRAG